MRYRWWTTTLALTIALALQATGCSSSPQTDDELPAQSDEGAAETDAVDTIDDVDEEAYESDVLPVGDSPILGDPEAPVTVVEFSSMQCPFCGQAGLVMEELVDRYDGDVRVVFKYYPLPNQPQAEPASRILEAVRRQDDDAFWEMKSALFERLADFGAFPIEELGAELAMELGLDAEQLREDFHDPEIAAVVERDFEMGQQMGVTGTPHFFVNGEVVTGAQPIDEFEAVVDRQLDLVDELLDKGVDEDDVYGEAVDRNLDVP